PRKFQRLVQTIAVHVVKPTVIDAANSFFFDVAVFQRTAPVRTMQSDKPQPALSVAEEHQLFTQDFDGKGNVLKNLLTGNRQPIAAKHFSGRSTGTNVAKI